VNIKRTSILSNLLHRQQPSQSFTLVLKAGIGGPLSIDTMTWPSHITSNSWLMAPLGANCVLLISVRGSPLSQPANVIGGYIVSTAIGLALHALIPVEWWGMGMGMGLAVGMAIAPVTALRVTDPPVGADPLVVLFDNPGWGISDYPSRMEVRCLS
jgi:CBS-domain-containing membrane protein